MDLGDLSRVEPLIKRSNCDAGLGRFYLLKSDFSKAKEHYEEVVKSAEENRDANGLFTGYTGIGGACEGLKDDAGAAEHYEKAVKLTEEIRSGLSPAQRERFFDVKINGFYRTAPYEGLARVQMRLNKPHEAFRTTEYTKARLFAEAMSRMSEAKNVSVPPEVAGQDESINNELAALKKNLQRAYEKKNKLVIESLEPQVKRLEEKLQAHIKMLREKYPLFAATKYPQPMDLDMTSLRDDEWVLAYHVTDPGLIVYLTKGKSIVKAVFKPVTRKEMDALVRKFRDPLELKSEDDVEKLKSFDFKAGKELSDILLGDVLSLLPKNTTLIVVPDDCLGVLPFEMLPLQDGGKIVAEGNTWTTSGAEFLGDRNPISYYQSVTALTLARTYGSQESSKGKLLVFADPVFQTKDARSDGSQEPTRIAGVQANLYRDLMSAVEQGSISGASFSRLPLTSTLADNLAGMFPGSAECYTGLQASKERFFNKVAPGLGDYDKIVFATHGYFGKDLPGIMEPVLILTLVPPGIDGFLRMSEVTGLKINADLVALTACQTGLGRKLSGEGTMGMGRAFQYAGAKSVLMSLWSVAESSSVDLVESFFRHLKDGKPKLEALKLARDEIRKTGYDHPFFWAPFILVGEVN